MSGAMLSVRDEARNKIGKHNGYKTYISACVGQTINKLIKEMIAQIVISFMMENKAGKRDRESLDVNGGPH